MKLKNLLKIHTKEQLFLLNKMRISHLFFFHYQNYVLIHINSDKIEERKGGMSMFDFGDDLKKIVLAGIGAVAITAEKSKDVVDQLVKKGELSVEQGKVLNEELKHNIADKLREPVTPDKISQDLEKLSLEDLEVLKAKIEDLQNVKREE